MILSFLKLKKRKLNENFNNFFIIFTTYSYAIDSLFTISTTITNIDSINQAKFQNVDWDSISGNTNHFIGENDSWYLFQVVGKESSGSILVNKLKGECK